MRRGLERRQRDSNLRPADRRRVRVAMQARVRARVPTRAGDKQQQLEVGVAILRELVRIRGRVGSRRRVRVVPLRSHHLPVAHQPISMIVYSLFEN